MISYQSPGVYVEEVAAGPQPIAAAPTSVVAIVGATRQGPPGEPTRVTGWAEFQAVFGGPVPGGFTAEAVYGFFENGGPAVYVVRADPSLRATWEVLRADGATVGFRAEATSPGAWANGLGLLVTPDTGAGGGQLFSAKIGGGTDRTLAAGTHTLPVPSSAGLTAGDPVRLVTPLAEKAATVANVQAASVDVVTAGEAITLPAGFSWIVADVPATATVLRPAAGSGFHAGDVLEVITPQLKRPTAVVTTVEPAGAGLRLELQAGPGQSVPGGEFAPRIVRLAGELTAAAQNVTLSSVVWRDQPAPRVQDLSAGHEAVAAGGLTGTFRNNRLEFPAEAPAGPIEVDARLVAHLFQEDVELVNPGFAALTGRYGFLPDGTKLRLGRASGNPLELTRDSTKPEGWTPAGAALNATWNSAAVLPPADARNGIVVRCARPPQAGDFIDLGTTPVARHRVAEVASPGGNVHVVRVPGTEPVNVTQTGPYPLLAFQTTRLVPRRFALRVTDGGTVVEDFRQLALHPDHPRFFGRDGVVNEVSSRIRLTGPVDGQIGFDALPALVRAKDAGADRAAGAADLKGAFDELERVTEPAMVICPDLLTLPDPLLRADVIGALTGHCERFRRFAIVDAPADLGTDLDLARWREGTVGSVQAGVYAPHVLMVDLDPRAGQRVRAVPPSGFVAGVFARTDRERGVHKAPANERVRGVVGLAEDYTQRRQDLLNPAGVNLIRAFPGRGIRIWGARTASADVQWRYVNVRRLFNLIETSVETGTQWVVFEPNTQSTWLRVRVSVENFLDQLWRSGALAGTTPQEAYRVRVGLGETMTETDVDLGLVITEVAVAPARPAEFVVFRFSQKRLAE